MAGNGVRPVIFFCFFSQQKTKKREGGGGEKKEFFRLLLARPFEKAVETAPTWITSRRPFAEPSVTSRVLICFSRSRSVRSGPRHFGRSSAQAPAPTNGGGLHHQRVAGGT